MTGDLTETVSRTGTASSDASTDDGAPRLIVACECGRLTVPALRVALSNLQEVTLGRDSRRKLTRQGKAAMLTVPDHEISRKHLVVRRQPAGWEVADLASKNGLLVNGEPTTVTTLNDGDVIEAGGTLLMFREEGGALDSDVDRDLASETTTPVAFRTVSAELEHRVNQLNKIAIAGVSVLIRGETGTGKELVARAVHDHGPQRGGPFVSVNLGALPRELAAAELFGAVKGAYTGATRDRDGLFRAARGGTLFLDEVGEAPPEVQAMLLRVLETGELYPVGGDRPLRADVRLIAATDANLEDHIARGAFKAPLLHRLAGYEIRLPPLRERREDIGALFFHFARQDLAAIGEAAHLAPDDPYARPWLPAALAMQLVRHAWPGNVRELRNATRQIVIANRGRAQAQLDPQLAAQLGLAPANVALGSQPAIPRAGERRKAADVGEPELREALRACTWDLKAAADRLGISRPSIYDLIARCPNIRTAGDLSADEIAQSFARCAGDLDAMVAELEVSGRALRRRIRELGLAD